MDPFVLLILTIFILALAAFGHAVFGFGGGLIAIPLLSLLMGVRDAVTLSLILQLITCVLLLRIYRHIAWRIVGPMLIGLLPGTIMGTYLLSTMSESALRIALAVFILLYLIRAQFFSGVTMHWIRHHFWGVFAGAAGGSIQGFIGTGGPPLVVYLRETVPEKVGFRASLLLIVLISNITRIALSLRTGLFTDSILLTSLYALPLFILALWGGDKLSVRLDERYYFHAVHVMLLGSVVALLINV